MVSLITENPWPLIFICLAVAAVALIALKFTGRGMFLMWALGAAGLAGLLWLADWYWVTDVERVEQVVQDLAAAVAASKPDRVVALLDPQVSLTQAGSGVGKGGEVAQGAVAMGIIRAAVTSARFDYVRVRHMTTTAGVQSGQGKCDFQVDAMGTATGGEGLAGFMTGPEGSDWSLGFVRGPDGTWKVSRITAIRLPGGANLNMPGFRQR